VRQRIRRVHAAVLAAVALVGVGFVASAWAGPENSVPELGFNPTAVTDSALKTHGLGVLDVPDIYGPGKVSTVCNVWMKTTNIGTIGNPFTAQSSDPSGQWPGASGVEFLYAVYLYVGAKDATVSDPLVLRRVSHATEWRPPSIDVRDRIYQSFDGQVNGARLVDDDSDGQIDEDPLDGWDNDGDGRVDEDYGAISQQEYTCVMTDNTEAAINTAAAEKHVPRGLKVRQNSYAFSVPGANDFSSIEWEVENISGHTLDSVYIGIRYDQDVGPISKDRYYSDDLPEPRMPQGPDPSIAGDPDDPENPNSIFIESVPSDDPRYQGGACTLDTMTVNGFSLVDDDGDLGLTRGASSIVLLGHTVDPTGVKGPRRVGWHAYAYYTPGVPFVQGGAPTNDQERFEVLAAGGAAGDTHIDPATGLINVEVPGASEIGDYSGLASVGPFLDFQPGEKVSVSWCLAVQECDYSLPRDQIRERYIRCIENAVEAVKTYKGSYESRQDIPVPGPNDYGRETCFYKTPTGPTDMADCHDDSVSATRTLKEHECTWFDLDCSYCTGVPGLVLKRWAASAPPPNPQLGLTPGDEQIALDWDNRSEYTPDPVKATFDFVGYKIWKAANWTRPVGSTGPGDELWSLLATYYLYDPRVNPLKVTTEDGRDSTVTTQLLLNRETGEIIYPYDVPCIELAPGVCDTAFAKKLTFTSAGRDTTLDHFPVIKYPIGRYRFVDRAVLNGFTYFYSVTAFDSTGRGRGIAKLEGRQAAVEADGVAPQSEYNVAQNDGKPYVVPNPYRGGAEWDLTPNATDPTGTHVDFFNLPADWTRVRIYTVSGDLVQELGPGDLQTNGRLQREATGDGQASWNLVSRNGQDVVSGIYIFSVDSPDSGTLRGKFTIIR
jgi:hypothetical protein